jgi:general secretion pathway protein B
VSYILEALKKAEAQRGRGDVPGLDAQHMPPEAPVLQPPTGGHGLLIGIIMVLGVAVIGLLLWSGHDTPAASASPAQPPVAPAPAPAQVPMQVPVQVPERAPVLVPPPDARDLPRHFQEPPPPATAHTGTTVTPTAAQPEHTRAAPAPRATDTPLPDELKAQFPRLNFGGAMHSDNAASRMLIVNGQLLHEGDTVAPELVLQRIELKSATFRYKGYTHTVQY